MHEARQFTDRSAARAWLKTVFGDWAAALTEPEREAIREYKGSGYQLMNRILRGEEAMTAWAEAAIDDLDLALSRMRLPEPVTVYRGLEAPHLLPVLEDLVGDVLEEHAYVSTSLIREIACTSLGECGEDSVLEEILIPGGAQVGAFVGAPDLVHDNREYEILLPRNTFLGVTGVARGDEITVVNMEVLT